MMNPTTIAISLLSILVVSSVSLIGILILFVKNKETQKKIQIYLISFAAGTMIAISFLKMLNESLQIFQSNIFVGKLIILGIILSFILEKVIYWKHCHLPITKNHKHHFAYLNIVGDFFHNFLDGIAITTAYSLNFNLGLTTTLAVITHEIPQEIGDFGILLYSGFTYKKALIYNFITALSAFLGSIVVFFTPKSFLNFNIFIPIIMGNFIYLATSDLIPELHKEVKLKESLLQLLFFMLGIGIIILI